MEYWLVTAGVFALSYVAGRFPARWLAFVPLVMLHMMLAGHMWLNALIPVALGFWFARGKRITPDPQPLHWGIMAAFGWALVFGLFVVLPPFLSTNGQYELATFIRRAVPALPVLGFVVAFVFRASWPWFGRPLDFFLGACAMVVKSTVQIFTLHGWYRLYAAVPLLLAIGVVWIVVRLVGPHLPGIGRFVGGYARWVIADAFRFH